MKLPWEKHVEAIDEVGAVYLFTKRSYVGSVEGRGGERERSATEVEDDSLVYEIAFREKFSVAATAMTYDENRQQIIVGLEDGMLNFFDIIEDFSDMKKVFFCRYLFFLCIDFLLFIYLSVCLFVCFLFLQVKTVHAHDARIGIVTYIQDKDYLLSAASDKTIQVYNRTAEIFLHTVSFFLFFFFFVSLFFRFFKYI